MDFIEHCWMVGCVFDVRCCASYLVPLRRGEQNDCPGTTVFCSLIARRHSEGLPTTECACVDATIRLPYSGHGRVPQF